MEQYENLGEQMARARTKPFAGKGHIYVNNSLLGEFINLSFGGTTRCEAANFNHPGWSNINSIWDLYIIDSMDRVVRNNPYSRWLLPGKGNSWWIDVLMYGESLPPHLGTIESYSLGM